MASTTPVDSGDEKHECPCSRCGPGSEPISRSSISRHQRADRNAAVAPLSTRFTAFLSTQSQVVDDSSLSGRASVASGSALRPRTPEFPTTSSAAKRVKVVHTAVDSTLASSEPDVDPGYQQVHPSPSRSLDMDVDVDYQLPPIENDLMHDRDARRLSEPPQNRSPSPIPIPSRPPSPAQSTGSDDEARAPERPPIQEVHLDEIKIALKFIEALKNASIDSEEEKLDDDMKERLRNPPQEILELSKNERLSIDIFLSITNASLDVYNAVRDAILRRYPDDEMLSYHCVKKLIAELSGIFPILRNMCVNSCIGYTGPFSSLRICPHCTQPRYDPEKAADIPRRQFYTIPIGPQLQALWASVKSAERLSYRKKCTESVLADLAQNNNEHVSAYTDFFSGGDYIAAIEDGRIKEDDMILVLSIDGAQLYRHKVSDVWIYIWIILDHAPSDRYKKRFVLPGGFIGGKPRYLDSFLFPGLHHLAAIQKEGLPIWDAFRDRLFISHPFLALATADGPGMAYLNGLVGHHGKHGCRHSCPLKGRRKPGAPNYYPARFKPTDYAVPGCDHDDVELSELLDNFTMDAATERYEENLAFVQSAPNQSQYEKRRLETGISKPSIFSGLPAEHNLGIPAMFVGDSMHLPALNLPDLWIPLWRGKFDCDRSDSVKNWPWFVLTDTVWPRHGEDVANLTKYIPSSFDRTPRNPAEKISSGYKAWEFMLYIYGMCPALLYGILPDEYWRHFCKIIRGIRILLQEEISHEEVIEAHQLITEYSDEFEGLYVQGRTDRIHFVRPSIHTISHIAPETIRVGPNNIFSQWAMERTIGNLGQEIKQHSNAFANLSERGVRRAQVNGLLAKIPDLEPQKNIIPRGAKDLGDGFVLLRKTDNCAREVRDCEAAAIGEYLEQIGEEVPERLSVVRWGRLRLPNGQILRSLWKEGEGHWRSARCAKVKTGDPFEIAEILFFMLLDIDGEQIPLAVASFFGPPEPTLLDASSQTYWSAQHLRDGDVRAFNVKDIQACVMMGPDKQYPLHFPHGNDGSEVDRWFLMEKPGLKLGNMIGLDEQTPDEE